MKKIIILIPVFNDWQSLFKLLENINNEVLNLDAEFSIIIVNDASTEARSEINLNLNNIKSIQVINMKENRGHARCIAAGLKNIFENEEFDHVIPMDGDGEDRPEEIKQFIDNLNYHPYKPIVGERIKRSEGILFKFCYYAHKTLTFAFAGHSIKFGNYTCLPKSTVQKMVNEKATWCSFSGSLVKVAKDRASVPSERGTRYFSPSKMSYINLIKHSLSILAVFRFNLLVRSILFLCIYMFLIYQNITIVMLIPVISVIAMIVAVFLISKRESIDGLKKSLENVLNIENIKQS